MSNTQSAEKRIREIFAEMPASPPLHPGLGNSPMETGTVQHTSPDDIRIYLIDQMRLTHDETDVLDAMPIIDKEARAYSGMVRDAEDTIFKALSKLQRDKSKVDLGNIESMFLYFKAAKRPLVAYDQHAPLKDSTVDDLMRQAIAHWRMANMNSYSILLEDPDGERHNLPSVWADTIQRAVCQFIGMSADYEFDELIGSSVTRLPADVKKTISATSNTVIVKAESSNGAREAILLLDNGGILKFRAGLVHVNLLS